MQWTQGVKAIISASLMVAASPTQANWFGTTNTLVNEHYQLDVFERRAWSGIGRIVCMHGPKSESAMDSVGTAWLVGNSLTAMTAAHVLFPPSPSLPSALAQPGRCSIHFSDDTDSFDEIVEVTSIRTIWHPVKNPATHLDYAVLTLKAEAEGSGEHGKRPRKPRTALSVAAHDLDLNARIGTIIGYNADTGHMRRYKSWGILLPLDGAFVEGLQGISSGCDLACGRRNIIATNAAGTYGTSGAPVLLHDGRVIGMFTNSSTDPNARRFLKGFWPEPDPHHFGPHSYNVVVRLRPDDIGPNQQRD
jgi:hypothetical protein